MIIKFPDNYPEAPPKVNLCTVIEGHPNVFDWGEEYPYICLDMLKGHTSKTPYEGWSSAYSVLSLLLQLQSFLFEENAVPQVSPLAPSPPCAPQARCACALASLCSHIPVCALPSRRLDYRGPSRMPRHRTDGSWPLCP